MSTAAFIAVLTIFFHDGSFVEVRSDPFEPSAHVSNQVRCNSSLAALERRVDWLQVAWRYGRIARVQKGCRQDGIDEIDV